MKTSLVPSAAPPADWLRLIRQSWPAVVASDLLDKTSSAWVSEGLSPPVPEEIIALAATGRLFRFGQPVCVCLPISAELTLPRLAFYLHRLRMDAAAGLIRSSWLNPLTMETRRDLLVFGRPRTLMRDFSTSISMRPMALQPHRPLEKSTHHRTILVSGKRDIYETLTALEQNTSPFAIIVNLTQQGCGTAGISLVRVLKEMFPGVPLVAVGHIGQDFNELPPMHLWAMRSADVDRARRHDDTPIVNKADIEIMAPSDPFFDSSIRKLALMNWKLKKRLNETGGVGKEMEALLKIERTLRSLNVPLTVFEETTVRDVHGRRYPIRMVNTWLDIAKRLSGRRGDIQDLNEQLISFLRRFIDTLLEAESTGRTQLIEQLCSEAITNGKHVVILVGNMREAEILQAYIEGKLGTPATDHIAAMPMDGAAARIPVKADWTIYACPLFPSRTPWLGLSSSRHIVLCHPYERERLDHTLRQWWLYHAQPSQAQGDKYRLWSLDWGSNDFLTDRPTTGTNAEECPVVFTEKYLEGEYPKHARVVTIHSLHGADDWLNALMIDPVPGHHDYDEFHASTSDNLIVIHLEGEPEPVRWPVNRQMLLLTTDDVEVCLATDLRIGNDLILLRDAEERATTQRELFEMFVSDNHGLSQTLRVASKWQQLVDGGIAKFNDAARLNQYFRSKGYDVHDSTVDSWARGGAIGPQDTRVILILAGLLNMPGATPLANEITNALKVIRSEHQCIGVDLRRAISASRKSGVGMVQIGSRRFAREVFDGMVQICRIAKIERPPIQRQSRRTISNVANEFAQEHGDKLLFTTACQRSMASSVFGNLLDFREILTVLVEGFHPMYAAKTVSLKDLEERLATIPASYAGGMSETTKGKYEQYYRRQYDGESVDISPHIKLGRVYDPKYTLRLHFHWDAKHSLIVVHHAGEHLPTRNG